MGAALSHLVCTPSSLLQLTTKLSVSTKKEDHQQQQQQQQIQKTGGKHYLYQLQMSPFSLRSPAVVAVFLLLVVLAGVPVTTAVEQQECLADGTCHAVPDVNSSLNNEQQETEAELPPIPLPQQQCELFLAESTLPNAGLGIFSTVEKEAGDVIGVGDICIPFVDMYWHNDDDFFPNPFRDYFWSGVSMGMHTESDTDDIEAYCPGLDCAVNCNPALLNVAKMTPDYDDGGLRRHRDPGVGAFTPYHNGTTHVARKIPAGGELFKDYGEQWFDYRYDIFGEIPLEDHFEEASAILKKMKGVVPPSAVSDETFEDLYKVILSLKNDDAVKSRIINAFPDSYKDAMKILEHHDGDIAEGLVQPKSVRDVDWLQRHGRCIDHIRPGHSKIRQAGHGAFANRNLPKGTLITTSPLHHVPDRAFANIYNFTLSEDGRDWVRVQDQIVTKQLMLNYCYSHPQSTVLLCPYGASINYINHDPNRNPNVKIRWAQNFPMAHKSEVVESGTIDDLAKVERPILAFDYVAIRDITEGDELYLDYGDDWVAAWSQHVQEYQPYGDPVKASHYEDARFWNQFFINSVLRTDDEQEFDPYPKHLEIRCHTGLVNNNDLVSFSWSDRDTGIPCRILFRLVVDEEDLQHFTATHGYKDTSGYRPELGDYVYTVEIEYRNAPGQLIRSVKTNIPRQSIAFADVPLTTDTRLPNAFRHWIGIPDEMMPEQWRNLRDGELDPVSALLKTKSTISKAEVIPVTDEGDEDDEDIEFDDGEEDEDFVEEEDFEDDDEDEE